MDYFRYSVHNNALILPGDKLIENLIDVKILELNPPRENS